MRLQKRSSCQYVQEIRLDKGSSANAFKKFVSKHPPLLSNKINTFTEQDIFFKQMLFQSSRKEPVYTESCRPNCLISSLSVKGFLDIFMQAN